MYNVGKVNLSKQIFVSTITKRKGDSNVKDGKRTFEFVFIPNAGFLNSNLPLLNNCELKLSFDRINASVAMLEGANPIKESCVGKSLEIKDCVAITEYVKSDAPHPQTGTGVLLSRFFNKIIFFAEMPAFA